MVWGQVRGVLLLLSAWFVNMLQFERCALQYGDNMPGTGTCELQFFNNPTGRVRSYFMSGKYNVTNQIDMRVQPSGVDELAMIGALYFDEVFSNFAAC